jgi:quercetin dioxygenase-like cupin family protein
MTGLPWREAMRRHPTARRLALTFDADRLATDLERFDERWWNRHAGPYHDGAWESVSLWAPRGDPFEQRSFGGVFAATPALALAPGIRQVLDQFSCERNRIRLMRLRPGGRILRHSDPLHTIDPRLVRLHVPVVTNPDVFFLVNDERVEMRPGEAWHVDVRFPHAVENRGSSTRVHLVMDLVRDPGLDQLLAAGVPVGHGRLLGYYAVHCLPTSLRRAWGLGN